MACYDNNEELLARENKHPDMKKEMEMARTYTKKKTPRSCGETTGRHRMTWKVQCKERQGRDREDLE